MDNFLNRTELLIGTDNVKKLQKSHVAVFGIGGVGSYTVEALVRAGIYNISIIDNDIIDITNINRQIIALESTVGKPKAEVMKRRIADINPDAYVKVYNTFFNTDTAENFDFSSVDYIADAVDDIKAKLKLAEIAQNLNIPIISAMGAGNKIDPTAFEVSDIYKTSVCPLARIMRRELKKIGIKKLKVVYSKETPKNPPYRLENEKTVGSLACVVPVMGLIMASEIIKDICDLS